MTHDLTCKELVELVTNYLEGTLPTEWRERFEAHLAQCGGCTVYLEQMHQTIRLTGTLSEDAITPEAKDKLLPVFRNWKNEPSAN